ncbi:MAG: hypothetical protein AAGD25_07945 [Cyanobacteria bacterium P01_F01_bin.150]
MAIPSLTSTTAFATSKASTTADPKVSTCKKGKSELNRMTDELKQPPSSEYLKRDKATLQRSYKPLKKNPFTTYRDPVTGRWLVESNKR